MRVEHKVRSSRDHQRAEDVRQQLRCGRIVASIEFVAVEDTIQIAVNAETHARTARNDRKREFMPRTGQCEQIVR